jgi:hydrogenase-4 membrane subunit HyfE
MLQIFVRFLVGGAVVSSFALIGDLVKPKSFAGLFGAAPSVALATLALTISTDGASFAATEARSMIIGAVAFFVYASLVSWIMMRRRVKALSVTMAAMPLWLMIAFAGWHLLLK